MVKIVSLSAKEIDPVATLSTSGFDVPKCATALRWLPQYAAYRKTHPISDYWNPADPLYDLPFPPPESPETQAALTTFLSVPFGLSVQELEDSGKRETKSSVVAFFNVLRQGIEFAIAEAARTLAVLVPPSERGVEEIAATVSDLMLFLGLIGLREFGRQRGWIAAQFQISSESLDRAMDLYDESKIEKNVMVGAFRTLDDECKLIHP